MLETGEAAPEFTLTSQDGEEVSLGQFRGGWVALHTFPAAFTGG